MWICDSTSSERFWNRGFFCLHARAISIRKHRARVHVAFVACTVRACMRNYEPGAHIQAPQPKIMIFEGRVPVLNRNSGKEKSSKNPPTAYQRVIFFFINAPKTIGT